LSSGGYRFWDPWFVYMPPSFPGDGVSTSPKAIQQAPSRPALRLPMGAYPVGGAECSRSNWRVAADRL